LWCGELLCDPALAGIELAVGSGCSWQRVAVGSGFSRITVDSGGIVVVNRAEPDPHGNSARSACSAVIVASLRTPRVLRFVLIRILRVLRVLRLMSFVFSCFRGSLLFVAAFVVVIASAHV
jgi:hypothetical protein